MFSNLSKIFMVIPNVLLQVAPCADWHVVISLNETVREVQTAKCILFLITAFLVLSHIIKRFVITRGGEYLGFRCIR